MRIRFQAGRWMVLASALGTGMLLATLLFRSNGLSGSVVIAQDEAPDPKLLAHASELSSAFRWVARRTLPAVVSIRTVRRVEAAPQLGLNDPLQGLPFGGGLGNSPLDDLFGDLRERMRQQQQQQQQQQDQNLPNQPRAGAGRPRRIATGEGSGFIIDADGVVMTNAHVVRDADEVIVILQDGTEHTAKDVRADEFADVAVLKIDVGHKLPVLPLGDDANVEIGDWVLAIGSPFGLESTVTQGIISAKSRGLRNLPARQEFLQTDAAINPGNSGGPLVNLKGEVIGINTAIETRSGGYDGVGFAVPVSLARWVSDQLLKDGKVRRAYVGVTPQDLTAELAEALELPTRRGVVVAEVRKGSPADKAGVQVEDVIVKLNGRDVASRQQLISIAERLRIGQAVPLVVIRDGKEMQLEVTAAEFPAEVAQNDTAIEEFGVEVKVLTPELARELEVDVDSGVVITGVARDSIAASIGLRPGMVLLRIGRTEIRSAEDVKAGLEAARERGQLVLLVRTANGTQLLSIPMGR
ncbi:MAG: Do family serine endopeptidase [Planctomycetota bacterium]